MNGNTKVCDYRLSGRSYSNTGCYATRVHQTGSIEEYNKVKEICLNCNKPECIEEVHSPRAK